MSDPVTVLFVVGAVLGAKTALEGLQEGNITKAIIGGVGAYFGVVGATGGFAGAAVAEGIAPAASGAMDAGLAGTSMMDAATLGGAEFAFNAGAVPASIGGSQIAIAEAGVGSLAPSMLASTPSQTMSAMNTGLTTPTAPAPNLLNEMPGPVSEQSMGGMDVGLPEPQMITTKAPNPQMQGSNEMMGNVGDAMGNMWESAKQTGTKLGEFAENNPFMATQMAGSAMQLLAGNQANKTAEEIAKDKEAWEREQMMLSATPANIYFDSSGVARDKNGIALQPG